MRRFWLSLWIIGWFGLGNPAYGYYSLGQPEGYVTDKANLFSNQQRQELEQELSAFEERTSNELAIVTIESLQGDTIEHFAVELFEEWQIGKKKADNGVLLLVAKEDRAVRIEVGYGLEGALTDAESSAIIRNVLIPAFRENSYYTGVREAVGAIEEATAGEYVGTEDESESDQIGAWIFFGIFGLQWLVAILARSKSWWAGGVLGALIALAVTGVRGFFYSGLVSLALLVPLGLLLDYVVSKGFRESKAQHRSVPWWAGGNSWGKGGSSGGFGGFGGGSSGGGGASGRW